MKAGERRRQVSVNGIAWPFATKHEILQLRQALQRVYPYGSNTTCAVVAAVEGKGAQAAQLPSRLRRPSTCASVPSGSASRLGRDSMWRPQAGDVRRARVWWRPKEQHDRGHPACGGKCAAAHVAAHVAAAAMPLFISSSPRHEGSTPPTPTSPISLCKRPARL